MRINVIVFLILGASVAGVCFAQSMGSGASATGNGSAIGYGSSSGNDVVPTSTNTVVSDSPSNRV